MIKIKIKKIIKKNFPNLYDIIFIFYSYILLRRKKDIKFSGWGLQTTTVIPWESNLKNNTSLGFINAKKKLDQKIRSREFYLAQIENYYETENFSDVLNHYEELNYRHYVVYYSAMIAYENTKSRNVVECGVCEGITMFFCIANYNKDKNFKAYLYDSWEMMRKNELRTEKDLQREKNYSYLNFDIIKNNLKDFQSKIIYNKGFIPESFKTSINPENISWLHIDLNSSFPTLEALKFFYPKLEINGVILFDDYGHDGFEDTREVVENFFKDKEIQFLQLMTGQALIIKKH